jgi:hypothetical protein
MEILTNMKQGNFFFGKHSNLFGYNNSDEEKQFNINYNSNEVIKLSFFITDEDIK